MYLDYLNNNLILAGVVGILGIILSFIESKRSKEKYKYKSYFKIFILVTLCSFALLKFKFADATQSKNSYTSYSSTDGGGGSINVDNYSSINIGEPNF
jgi:uncharacterized membrane protein